MYDAKYREATALTAISPVRKLCKVLIWSTKNKTARVERHWDNCRVCTSNLYTAKKFCNEI